MNIIKKLFILISSLFFFNTYATWITNNENQLFFNKQEICNSQKYDIFWEFELKENNQASFVVKNIISQNNQNLDINIKILSNENLIKEEKNSKIDYLFQNVWGFNIVSNIKDKNTNCEYTIKKDINVYKKIIYYITDNKNINFSLKNDFYKNNILFNEIKLDTININNFQDNFFSKITNNINYLKNSDILIIDSDNFINIIQWFERLVNVYNIDLSNKKTFIFTNNSYILSKKLLFNYINLLKLNIFTSDTNSLLNFLNYLSSWKSATELIEKSMYWITKISFDNKKNSLLLLTNITNNLIINWFSINILGILFSLCLVFTFWNFVKHVVWISVFSLYYPIFFALCVYLFDIKFILVLFFSALIWFNILNLIYKKIHFLSNSKISIYIVFYVILAITFLWILNLKWYLIFDNLKTNFVIFPFIIIPMAVYKIYNIEKKIFTFWFILYNLEFFFISLLSYFILKNSFIQSLLLSYTELLIIILLLNILIWKFTWLQLLEYFRFLPLLKKNFSNEEE